MAKASKAQRDKLATLRDRFEKAKEADQENRELALEDLRFLHEPGEQWDAQSKSERGDRPCYEFNKLRVTVKRIVNDMRANRPAGKVLGTEEGDKDTAEILEGLIRNVWNVSDGDTTIDQAAEYQVGAGMAAWRVTTQYSSDTAWEQDIVIEGFRNPLCVYVDPAAQDPMYRDARYWFVVSKIAKEVFEKKYPKQETADFEDGAEFDDDDEWDDGEYVRIVEYWYKEPAPRTVVMLSDGRTVYAEEAAQIAQSQPELQVLRSREVMTDQVKMCIASGNAILEEADWAGSQFPFVMVHGERVCVDGKNMWWGVTRFAKDAQRAYNFSRTLAVETVALSPQAKWWATPEQASGHTEKWAEAHKKNYPFLLFNADPKQPGAPQRMGGAEIPAALVQEIQIASEDIKAVTGIFDASLGNRSNETTGVAIRARQAQGEIAVFNYMDNLAKGVRRTWEILVDLIPKIYDTPRMVRLLGVDGAEKFAQVNAVDPMTGETVNDLSRGKFDVTVTVGPSFSTQRQEASEVYMALGQANPAVWGIAGDLIFKALDLPYSDKIAERLKLMLPPQIQQMESQGKELPPEAQAAMAQAEQAMAMVDQQAAALEEAAEKMEAEASDLEATKAEIKGMIADLKVQEANLRTFEAQLEAKVAQAGSDLDRRAMEVEGQQKDVQTAAGAMEQNAMQAGQASALELVQQALQVVTSQIDELKKGLADIGKQQPIIVTGGGNRQVRVKRVNGELVGEMTES
jgi:hypothetical protein